MLSYAGILSTFDRFSIAHGVFPFNSCGLQCDARSAQERVKGAELGRGGLAGVPREGCLFSLAHNAFAVRFPPLAHNAFAVRFPY